MVYYALQTTHRGISILKDKTELEKLTIRKSLLLSVCTSSTWVEYREVLSRLNTLYDNLCKQDSAISLALKGYTLVGDDRLSKDIHSLVQQELLWVAEYRAPNGKLYREKPQGLRFRTS